MIEFKDAKLIWGGKNNHPVIIYRLPLYDLPELSLVKVSVHFLLGSERLFRGCEVYLRERERE